MSRVDTSRRMNGSRRAGLAALVAASLISAGAHAQEGKVAGGSADIALSPARTFAARGGEALFKSVCAGCHMADGGGAVGAGTYPALARNPKLESAGYPVSVLVMGLRGMPPLGRMMSDEQVADVVNYVRTHLGNSYADPVSAADVAPLRP